MHGMRFIISRPAGRREITKYSKCNNFQVKKVAITHLAMGIDTRVTML